MCVFEVCALHFLLLKHTVASSAGLAELVQESSQWLIMVKHLRGYLNLHCAMTPSGPVKLSASCLILDSPTVCLSYGTGSGSFRLFQAEKVA